MRRILLALVLAVVAMPTFAQNEEGGPVSSAVANNPTGYTAAIVLEPSTGRVLYEHNADVVINGHDHLYERFGKQDVDGRSYPRGLRQFTVGTGGARLYPIHQVRANSQARYSTHGVLPV